jgi:hypothetical protein
MAKALGLSAIGTAAAAVLATSAPAEATTIIQNFNVNSGNSFSLQQFDSSLGTLESVDVLFNALTRRNVANPAPGPGGNIFTLHGFANLTSADAGAPVLPNWEVNTTDPQSKFNSPYELQAGGPTQTTSITTGLNSFTGTSSFNYLMTAGIDILGSTAPYGATSRNDGSAAISVRYNFKEAAAAVPEPATWGMMIVGFGAIGASMRRRNKGAEPAPTV